jgi:hypothetical protein
MKTVAELRRMGYKVKVSHYRWYLDEGLGSELDKAWALLARYEAEEAGHYDISNPDCCGGLTEIELSTPDGKTVKTVAECADEDGFSKKIGVNIALKRALVELKLYDFIRNN